MNLFENLQIMKEAELFSAELNKGSNVKTLKNYMDEFGKKYGSVQARQAADEFGKKVSELLKTSIDKIYWADEGSEAFKYFKNNGGGRQSGLDLGIAGNINLYKVNKDGREYIYHKEKEGSGMNFFYA